jgi:hypothetical protein
MRPVAPRLRDDIEELAVAEEQPEFKPLTMARVICDDRSTMMVARWTFTPEERRRICKGEDVYVSFPEHTFPHQLTLRPEWADK